ncbi:helicase-associated domain-containing protein [Effusibacillus lacus]|uniref:Helicase XPB/Ssl2 N-terminal domain-containing protein n=1 Tax=Effusibacillus lacus TaxID=1348429 RepID=A0A292YIK6_9BACL|nr:helicase-associated domain-containing protein [Effusibacillus lacus]TCS75313.1 XPB/Ssl2-like helicase family protein [Effusibacillus lacus]GAX89748.1 hypothetical protein EFBL_1373 [Effusibacillus lacus]
MRLSECLNSSDINTLKKIAETHRLDCHRSSKNSLMQAIMSRFNNRKFVYEKLDSVDSEHYREALLQLVLDKRQSFSREDLAAIAKRVTGSAEDLDKRLISKFLQDGWMYRLGSGGGGTAYYLPEDLSRTMKEYMAAKLQSRVERTESAPIVYRDDQFAIIRDTVQFISFVKNNEVKTTMEGVIYKRQLMQLLESMEVKEEAVGTGWRFGYGRRFYNYPDRFALIYDYCYGRGIVEEQEAGFLSLTNKTETWLLKSDKDKLMDLVKFWRLLYRRPIPRISLVTSTIATAAKAGWTLKESVNRLVASYVSGYYYDSQEQVMEKRVYQMMVYLGLLCIGKLADGRQVMKLSDVGRELLLEEKMQDEREAVHKDASPLIVHPNFEVLLPASESRLGWELNQFADLALPDLMRIYRLTKGSVSRGFQSGWTADRMVEFLERYSGSPVPVNVKRMIARWCDEQTADK